MRVCGVTVPVILLLYTMMMNQSFIFPDSQRMSSDSGDSSDELCHHYAREDANVDTLRNNTHNSG
jgi:hypothetical protein